MLLGNGRIQYLGNRHQHFLFFHRNGDGIPQILIALDMGRHPHLVNDGGDSIFQIIGDISIFFLFIFAGQLPDALTHRAHPAGLGHIVVRSLGGGQLGHASLGKTGQDQHLGPMLQLSQPDPQLMEYVSRSLLLSSQYLREAGDASASALRQEQAYAVARAFDVELGEGSISQNELDELFARSGLDAETLGV